MKGSWRPTIAPSFTAGRSVTCASTVIGVPSAPKATGAVLKISVTVRASERRHADHDQQRAGDRDRRAEARDAFEQAAEAKADHHQHDAPVIRQMRRASNRERHRSARK